MEDITDHAQGQSSVFTWLRENKNEDVIVLWAERLKAQGVDFDYGSIQQLVKFCSSRLS